MQTVNGGGMENSCDSILFWAAMAAVVKNTVNNRPWRPQPLLQLEEIRCETMVAI